MDIYNSIEISVHLQSRGVGQYRSKLKSGRSKCFNHAYIRGVRVFTEVIGVAAEEEIEKIQEVYLNFEAISK